MDWHELRAAGSIAVVGALLVWVLAAVLYVEALRSMLAARERALQEALHRFAGALASWQMNVSGFPRSLSRESVVALDQLSDELESEGRLREKVAALDDSRRLIEEAVVLSRAGSRGAGAPASILAGRLAEARRLVGEDVSLYNAAAADVAFVVERFPLSLLAAAAGMATRPLLAERSVSEKIAAKLDA